MPLLASWGIAVRDPVKEFAKIDKNGDGICNFEEFAGWAVHEHLHMDPNDTLEDEKTIARQHKTSAYVELMQLVRQCQERKSSLRRKGR